MHGAAVHAEGVVEGEVRLEKCAHALGDRDNAAPRLLSERTAPLAEDCNAGRGGLPVDLPSGAGRELESAETRVEQSPYGKCRLNAVDTSNVLRRC
jgi:hypothetical protein